MSWDKNDYIKVGYFYFAPGHGNGDLLYNTCRKIIETNDKSDWARWSLVKVCCCLSMRIRWPDSMSEKITTTTHTQGQITRDPYILFYACCVYLGRNILIKRLKPPLKLYTPAVWSWRRYLINPTWCNKRVWLLWEWVSPTGKKEFAQVLKRYRFKTVGL